jgi:TPR repeat protein
LSPLLQVDCPISPAFYENTPKDIKKLSLAFFGPSLVYRDYLNIKNVSKKRQSLSQLADHLSNGNAHAFHLLIQLCKKDAKVFAFLKAYNPLKKHVKNNSVAVDEFFKNFYAPLVSTLDADPIVFWEVLDPANVCTIYCNPLHQKPYQSRKTFKKFYDQTPDQIDSIAFQMATKPTLFPNEPFWAHLATENGSNQGCTFLANYFFSKMEEVTAKAPGSGPPLRNTIDYFSVYCYYLFKTNKEEENKDINIVKKKRELIQSLKNLKKFDKAKFYGKMLADQGDKEDQFYYAKMFSTFYETSKKIEDLNEALKYFELAAKQGLLNANAECIGIYSIPPKEDKQKVLEHLQFMEEKGSAIVRNTAQGVHTGQLNDNLKTTPNILMEEIRSTISRDFAQAIHTGQLNDNLKTALNIGLEVQDPGSQYVWAQTLEGGVGVPKDLQEAFEYRKRAADKGNSPSAQYMLAEAFNFGQGVPKDPIKAVEYYKRAAENGKAEAQYDYSILLKAGQGVPKDPKKAFEYCKRAADQEYAPAQNACGLEFEEGEVVREDLKEASKYYKLSAEQGYAEAQSNYALMLENGKGVPKDLKKAAEYYKLSADQKYAPGQHNYSVMLERGAGVPKDLKKAADYSKLSADQKYAPAQFNWALMLEKGEVVREDLKEAAKYYKLSADQGFAPAEYCYALMLRAGKGVTKDLKKAFEYFQRAAARGDAEAKNECGVMLKAGEGVLKDLKKAFEYFQRAAENGKAEAQYNCALMLERGEGVPKNLALALKYYQLSADQGRLEAQNNWAVLILEVEGNTKSKEALKYLKRAADQGHVNAQYNYASRLWQVSKKGAEDLEIVLKYYKSAADNGHPQAPFFYAQMLASGEGVPQDLEDAFKYYKLSADREYAPAQFSCGQMLIIGKGVTKNLKEGLQYLKSAADNGIPEAQYRYAQLLNEREGMPINFEEEFKYYQLAANQGDASAQYNCAVMLEYGEGVPKSPQEALKYYQLSADNGNLKARILLHFKNNIHIDEMDDVITISFSNDDTPLSAESLAKKEVQQAAPLHTLNLTKKDYAEIGVGSRSKIEHDKQEKTTVKHLATLDLVQTIFGQGTRKINTFSNTEAQQAFADLGCTVNENQTENSTFLSYDLGEGRIMKFKYHNPHGHGDQNLYKALKRHMKKFLVSINKTPETLQLK